MLLREALLQANLATRKTICFLSHFNKEWMRADAAEPVLAIVPTISKLANIFALFGVYNAYACKCRWCFKILIRR